MDHGESVPFGAFLLSKRVEAHLPVVVCWLGGRKCEGHLGLSGVLGSGGRYDSPRVAEVED